MWMGAFRVLMGIAVLGCIAASATFAFEFGWTRGATEVHRWTYALAGVALDVIKAGLPIFGALAWHDSKPARSVACWLVFTVLTGLSLWCAYGTTATQLAVKFADQAVASTTQATKQGKLDRLLEDKRKQQPYTVTSAEALRGSQDSARNSDQPAQDGVRREQREARPKVQGSRGGRAHRNDCGNQGGSRQSGYPRSRAARRRHQGGREGPGNGRRKDRHHGGRPAIRQHGQGDRCRSEPDRCSLACVLRHRHRVRERRRLLAGVRAWRAQHTARRGAGVARHQPPWCRSTAMARSSFK